MGVVILKRKIYRLVVEDDADFFSKRGTAPKQDRLDLDLEQFITNKLNYTPDEDKEKVREQFQRKVIESFYTITKGRDVRDKNYKLFDNYTRKKQKEAEWNKKRKMIGRGFVSEDGRFNAPEPARADKYLKLGKYKANKEKLVNVENYKLDQKIKTK